MSTEKIMLITIGSMLTIGTTWAILSIVGRKLRTIENAFRYKQSDMHEMIKDYLPEVSDEQSIPISQSRNHIHQNMIKVVMVEDRAYWVMDNVFYVAKAIHGRIDPETTEPLDIINMPQKELNIMLDILDSLKMGSGSNDSGSSRHE